MHEPSTTEDKTTYVVTDDKGQVHKISTNLIGQKVRRASSVGRIWFTGAVIGGGSTYLHRHTHGVIMVALIVLVIFVAYQLICKVVVTGDELKTMRPIKATDKLA